MNVQEKADAVFREVGKAVTGQDKVVANLLAAVLANGHVLLEGVPGVAKTLLVRSIAKVFGLSCKRIQFTPDLMPSDVLGTRVFNPQTAQFELRTGPIFTSILLADEINRTPPKTQAALLEAMEERTVTLDGEVLPLPAPFIVMATQNPVEFEGVYPLPEAQQDRFLMKLLVGYPDPTHEIDVIRRHHEGFKSQDLDTVGVSTVVTGNELAELQQTVEQTTVEDKILNYIQGLVAATRSSNDLLYGASPRACIALLRTSKAQARIRGRDFVIPDDVRELALPVLRHRIVLRPEAEIEGLASDQVLDQIIAGQTVPR